LAGNFEFIGDKGYKRCKYVKVCEDKQEKSKRQILQYIKDVEVDLWTRRRSPKPSDHAPVILGLEI
jgi:exodeoxyribonuclease-3